MQWKTDLKNIIDIAVVDSDQWVSMVGELLKSYPQKGTINFSIDENSTVFNDLVNELKKLVKKHNDQGILPIECLYLNKNALTSIIGNIPPPSQHFKLRKNPKSFDLRNDLLNKSEDAAHNLKKGNLGSLPIRNRSGSKDLNDQTPLKGIPRSINSSQFKMPTIQNRLQIGAGRNPTRPSMPGVRRDVGIKFLDQPVNLPDSKKKKKAHDTAENNQQTANKSKENDKATIDQTPTHYAAGLDAYAYVPPSPAVHNVSAYNESQTASSTNQQQQQQNDNLDHHQPPPPQPVYQSNLMNTMHYAPDHNLSGASSIEQMQTSSSTSNLVQQSPAKKNGNVTTLTKQQADELRQISKCYQVDKNVLSLIMNFMNGKRINSPNDDDVVRVKLGEKREVMKQPDGTFVQVISDGFYQMDHKTGEGFTLTTNRRIVNITKP